MPDGRPDTDPYDLIRDALPIMRRAAKEGDLDARAWVRAYRKLPGADLTRGELRILCHPELRKHHPNLRTALIERGYLVKIESMRGNPGRVRNTVSWRVGQKGREGMRLRNEL